MLYNPKIIAKKILFFFTFIGITSFCFSNNVVVSNVRLTGQDFSAGINNIANFTHIEFDLSWDNSWRTSTLESNWDACWVFVKYRMQGSSVWNHVTLNVGGHNAAAGSTIDTPADGKGAFIYKSTNGIGTNTWIDAQLRWNYGVDGLLDDDLIEVCVFAIEMVYVPSGAFYAGDGNVSNLHGHFEAGTSSAAFQVPSESALTLGGGGAGSLGNHDSAGMSAVDDFGDAVTQILPAAYPKGFNAYYAMKYEITQEQYVAFLNKLTFTQQAARTAVAPNSAAGTAAIGSAFYRNGIDIQTPGVSAATPAVYACNLNNNATYSEAGDGQNIACNYLSWADLAAYLDWSGLRPMTELEFEKSCRGNQAAVDNEYAWGNTTVVAAAGITNGGLADEIASNAAANCVYNNVAAVGGPMRGGNFAQGATNRESSGGSYYGIMELSGNLWERCITVGNPEGRSFTGINGDGSLDAAGDANVTNWPATNTIGSGYRGGRWTLGTAYLRVSSRSFATFSTLPARYLYSGGRGVRIAP